MKRRSTNQVQLRAKEPPGLPEQCRKRKIDGKRKSDSATYERDRKRRQRAAISDGTMKKRGPKERIGLKSMSIEERKRYERERKRLLRNKKKEIADSLSTNADSLSTNENIEELANLVNVDIADEEVMNFNLQTGTSSTSAIFNIISSPMKKRDRKYFFNLFQEKLSCLNDYEKYNVYLVSVYLHQSKNY